MNNITANIDGNKLTIVIDTSITIGPSKSGKTTLIASTGGNQKITTPAGEIVLGVNCYKQKPLF